MTLITLIAICLCLLQRTHLKLSLRLNSNINYSSLHSIQLPDVSESAQSWSQRFKHLVLNGFRNKTVKKVL